MQPFTYLRASNVGHAVTTMADASNQDASPRENIRNDNDPAAQFIAGGTTMLDLMKLGALTPERLVDIKGLGEELEAISLTGNELRLGALATMEATGRHPDIQHYFPVIAQSLMLAASTQIRNMATLGGNVLQRTRCNYFRDSSWHACNKRKPGSGCGAIDGVNRKHAILGVSDACIAAYPGDFAQALIALDARVEIRSQTGSRLLAFEELHLLPGDTPQRETSLALGELITAFLIPRADWMRRSLYLKIRDRESYEFALSSVAIAIDLDGGKVRQARIGLGGVAAKPWRAREAEAFLAGKALNETVAASAAAIAFRPAILHGGNDYKKQLGQRTLMRALLQAQALNL